MRSWSALAGVVALFAGSAFADLDPIVIKGSKFFYKTNGTQFFIQGVAYQQDYSTNSTSTSTTNNAYTDPLADAARCEQDIPLLKALNTNTIRVYAVDLTKNHDTCMQLLQDNGIYVIADLSEPRLSINRNNPFWNDDLHARYTGVVDKFASYSNVIGFFAGNEVSNQVNNTAASAFVKAAVRDTKLHIAAKKYPYKYVGYAMNDDAAIRNDLAHYFNCGDQSAAIDFLGSNIYSWCGDSSFTESGYDQRVNEFSKYSVPSFFAEYGCNTVLPRKFTEVETIFSSNMTRVFSGAILYMYFQATNNYGLVQVKDSSVSLLPDYTAYSNQMAKISPTGVAMADYTPSNSPAKCPSVASGSWEAAASPLPPVVNPDLCSCMYNGLACSVKSSISTDLYSTLFSQVCSYGNSCTGILANATNGTYGAYSTCNSTEQLSFAFNQYYISQGKTANACDFGGTAGIKKAASASSGTCGSLLSAAGTDGTGTVTAKPNSSATKSGAAGALTVPKVEAAYFTIGAYMLIAMFLGAGMIIS